MGKPCCISPDEMASCSMILPWQAENVVVLLVELWIARLPAHRVASAFHLPWVELLPSNQLQIIRWGLSNFNNQNLGSSAVKIDRDFSLIKDSFYCFKIAHCYWENGQMRWWNCHWLLSPSKFYISELKKDWKCAAYLYWSPTQNQAGGGMYFIP